MDENEITTVADTQAENTADTADTGQTTPTTEELIQQLGRTYNGRNHHDSAPMV